MKAVPRVNTASGESVVDVLETASVHPGRPLCRAVHNIVEHSAVTGSWCKGIGVPNST